MEHGGPLSAAQQRMWFMHQLEPDSALYNVPTVLSLRGPLDVAALGRALDALVNRHEALRTTFPAPGGVPYQSVAATGTVHLSTTDVSTTADPARATERIALAEASTPLDLVDAPPLRAHLVRLGPAEHRLCLTFHHVLIDGWSVEVAYRELGALYSAEIEDVPSRLAEVSMQYPAFARRQRDTLTGETLDELVAHWRDLLGDDPAAPALPTDSPRPRHRRFRGAHATRDLDPTLVGALRALSKRHRATLYMTTLAGFMAQLGGWSGSTEVTVGTPTSGRTVPELADIVGCLINMVPVRVDLSGAPDFTETLERVRGSVLGALSGQELPFDRLVDALITRRGRDYSPIFRVMFSFVGEITPPAFAGLRECSVEVHSPPGTAKFDLSLYVKERGHGLALELEYDTDLYTSHTAAALLLAYAELLADAVARPETPIAQLVAASLGALVTADRRDGGG